MAKKQIESTVNPVVVDEVSITENASPQSDIKIEDLVLPAEEMSSLTTAAVGVLKSRH